MVFKLQFKSQIANGRTKSLADLGVCLAHTPPLMGPNSFIFAYIFSKECLCQRSTPLPQVGPRPLWEILDPPLI